MKKILSKIFLLFCSTLFYISSFIITVFLYLCTGYTHPLILLVLSIIGFVFVVLFRNKVWRRFVVRTKPQTRKDILRQFLIFFLLCQVFVIVVIPINSLLPKWVMESAHIIRYIEGKECSIEEYMNDAESFWGNQIDFSKVHVVEGGIMTNLHSLQKIGWIAKDNNYVRDASVFGNTIYLMDAFTCQSKPTIFHELTHVWQMQTQRRVLFGISKIPGFIYGEYQQFFDPHAPYEYGGYEGLKKAKEDGKTFFDFGMEQQAMIVQHLTWFNNGFTFSESEGGQAFARMYKSILQGYVEEMLAFKP